MKKYTVFVAGGSGSRMKSAIPKQFMLLAGKPVVMHTIQLFNDYDSAVNLILVLPEAQIMEWEKLCKTYNFNLPHQVIAGGETRFHSVQKGLSLVDGEGLVAVHDGVRPLVSKATISTIFSTAETKGNAVPCIQLNDSIRKVSGDKNEAVLRSDYRLIQTPQCFKISILKKAFEQNYSDSFTDCASVLEAAGGKINLVEGNPENIKITTPYDLIVAESFLKK
jgi:2-C-methyl-D-erythritol 4-phosphate cytidylyltransferase